MHDAFMHVRIVSLLIRWPLFTTYYIYCCNNLNIIGGNPAPPISRCPRLQLQVLIMLAVFYFCLSGYMDACTACLHAYVGVLAAKKYILSVLFFLKNV
jgi:hypothetical protein